MKILVTGSSGLLGSALLPVLKANGHEVIRMVRSAQPDCIQWDPGAGTIDTAALEAIPNIAAAVHLAGENIAGRWTVGKKEKIRKSRINGTRMLAEALGHLLPRPKVLVCASAIGFYGNRGDEMLTEVSAMGNGFLAEVCRDWEAAAQPAASQGIRVVFARLGVVLSPAGGALSKMLFPFRMGVGGVVGSGRQYLSWITPDDASAAINHSLVNESLNGPVNLVTPNPVTNHEFTKTLGRVLSRPTVFPLPAFAARLALGEMADHLLLGSTRVQPVRLAASGYSFMFPELEGALRHVLGKWVQSC